MQFRVKKKYGWGLGMMLKFANGKELNFPMQNDEYGILYNNHFIQRPACYVCKFRGVENRLADITIGDFWGLEPMEQLFIMSEVKAFPLFLQTALRVEHCSSPYLLIKKILLLSPAHWKKCTPAMHGSRKIMASVLTTMYCIRCFVKKLLKRHFQNILVMKVFVYH